MRDGSLCLASLEKSNGRWCVSSASIVCLTSPIPSVLDCDCLEAKGSVCQIDWLAACLCCVCVCVEGGEDATGTALLGGCRGRKAVAPN